MSKEFRKYTNPYSSLFIFFTIWSGGFLLLFLLAGTGDGTLLVADLIFAVVTLIFLSPLWKGRKFVKQLETDPKLVELIEEDFRNAVSMANDSVRFGKLWIYTRHGGRLLGYSDISRVYQHINRYMFFEIRRWLECDTVPVQSSSRKGKKTFQLCNLKRRGKSDAELQEIVNLLLSKNPDIKVGYN